jgi:GTP-binding protein HflX
LYSQEESAFTESRRAVLVGLQRAGQPGYEVEEHLDELQELARTAGTEVVDRVIQRRGQPHPATFIGQGKAREVGEIARHHGADLLLFDDDLTASQVKNLEKIVDGQVLDRSSLILEIFSQRARTREARTQVELARLSYLLPRLTRRWKHLSRQAGGIGVRGGEGETQLEADRRMLRQRIGRLKKELERIERTREVQRRGRLGVPVVALAGYTNAGKSTLFNRLTRAGVLAENRLFATLDSTLRRGALAPGKTVVFADTVGFIRKLPHHLVSSFRSTLGEIAAADLVVHVVDRSHPSWEEQARVAEEVLHDLGIEPERILRVLNKCDLLGPAVGSRSSNGVTVSALTNQGLDILREEITTRLTALGASGYTHSPQADVGP